MASFDDSANSDEANALTASRHSFGELVYQACRSYVSTTATCKDERLAAFTAHHADFVQAIDTMIPPDMVNGALPDTVGASLLPLVDDGSLPALTTHIADMLTVLTGPIYDPDHATIEALLHVINQPNVISRDHVYALLSQLLKTVDAKQWLHQIAILAQTPVDHTNVVAGFIDVGRHQIARFAQPLGCDPVPATHASSDETVDTTSVRSILLHSVPLNRPNGPALAEHLNAPFTYAHTDDDGSVSQGIRDAQTTGLAYATELFADAASAGIVYDVFSLVAASMPNTVPCHDGTPHCESYPDHDNAYADLAYLGFEMLRYPRALPLLTTWHQLIHDNPLLTERILVALGKMLRAIEQSHITWTEPALFDMAQSMMPLVATMLAVDPHSSTSTPEQLLEVLHDLGRTAREFPPQLSNTITYVNLTKDRVCTDAKINVGHSTPVDYTKPRWIQAGHNTFRDNRSALEQIIELMVTADCGTVPFTQKTVTEYLIHVLADKNPGTVCTAIDALFGVLNILPSVSEAFGATALDMIGCDGSVVWGNLHALDQLARSGALDTFLPLARVFVDHDHVRTLLQLFTVVYDDLMLDEDTSATTHSTIRRLLPVLKQILDAGVADSLFDLDALLVTIPNPDHTGTMANESMRALDFMLSTQHPVHTRQGVAQNTSLALEAVKALQRIVSRLHAADVVDTDPAHSQAGNIDTVLHYASTLLTQTYIDNRETSAPEDDVERLLERRLLPLLQEGLDISMQLATGNGAHQQCVLDALQQRINGFLTSADFVHTVRVLNAFSGFAGRQTITQIILATMAEATASAPHAPLHQAFLQVMAEALQMSIDPNDVYTIAAYIAYVMQPEQLASNLFIATADHILWNDPHDTMMTIARNGLASASPGTPPPMDAVLNAIRDVIQIRTEHACQLHQEAAWTTTQVTDVLQGAASFMRDDAHGLGSIYRLIGLRAQRH